VRDGGLRAAPLPGIRGGRAVAGPVTQLANGDVRIRMFVAAFVGPPDPSLSVVSALRSVGRAVTTWAVPVQRGRIEHSARSTLESVSRS
jgi:hypothetical protein